MYTIQKHSVAKMKFWKKNERGSEMRFLSKYGSHAKRKI